MRNRTPVPRDQRPPIPEFTPVPLKQFRHDGFTPERQRAFIEALADTGSVRVAARMINMSERSCYMLRRHPGAAEFRRAWEAALDMGVLRLRDEAFDRAMHGELIPVFVADKLLGFRRKKNDRLLMFCLKHYGHDAEGKRVTINYFSTKATAGSGAPPAEPALPSRLRVSGRSGSQPDLNDAGRRSPETGSGEGLLEGSTAQAQASTTTLRTTLTTPAGTRADRDDTSAAILEAFEGVDLDPEAQQQILAALAACAERRRALLPEDDPDRDWIPVEETRGGVYTGQLESGVETAPDPFRPGELSWEGMGEGGVNAEIERAVASVQAHKALPAPARKKHERAMDAEDEARRARQNRHPRCIGNDSTPDEAATDWRNYSDEE